MSKRALLEALGTTAFAQLTLVEVEWRQACITGINFLPCRGYFASNSPSNNVRLDSQFPNERLYLKIDLMSSLMLFKMTDSEATLSAEPGFFQLSLVVLTM